MTRIPQLPINSCVEGAAVPLSLRALAHGQVVFGEPRAGAVELGRVGECTVGVWEISPGVSSDVEVDEFFVVLSGEASVAFADGSPPLHLKAGCIGRLAAGSATTWTVATTLRKVYIA